MGRATKDLLTRVKALVDAGVLARPKWLEAVAMVPPIEPRRGGRPPTIRFPEDRLVQAYYAKFPQARLAPLDMSSFEPPRVRRFVTRQMELMEGGMERRAAFKAVEEEMKDDQCVAEEAQWERPGVRGCLTLHACLHVGHGKTSARKVKSMMLPVREKGPRRRRMTPAAVLAAAENEEAQAALDADEDPEAVLE
ncbi:hypothetical protein H632_c2742p0, partial [Helicosporidium sp. ATCC 50920]